MQEKKSKISSMLFFHFLHAPEDSYIFFAIFLCLVTIDECVFSVTDQGEGPTIADICLLIICVFTPPLSIDEGGPLSSVLEVQEILKMVSHVSPAQI